MKINLGLGALKFSVDTEKNTIPNTWLNETQEQELGGSGTKIFSGIITKDLNEKLNGLQAIAEFEKMRTSDGQVQACLLCMKLPLLACEWRVEPAIKDDPESVKIAEFVQQNLFEEMSITWDDFLRQALLLLDFGFSNFEKVFMLDKGAIKLKKIAPRLPVTHYKWIFDDKNHLTGWQQQVIVNNVTIMPIIPIDKLVIYNINQEGDNYEGRSILRSAWKHWYIKDSIYRISNIGVERNAIGTPIMTMPAGATVEDRTKSGQIMQSLRAHNKGYAVIPNGFTLDIKAGDLKMSEIMQYIQHHDTKISTSMLAQFINLGQDGGGGSYSLSQDSTDFFLLSLNAVAKKIEDVTNKYIVQQLVRYNFPVDKFPKVKCGEIGAKNKKAIAEALQILSNGQLIQPDTDTEKYLRNLWNLPEINEKERMAKKTEAEQKAKDSLELEKAKVNANGGKDTSKIDITGDKNEDEGQDPEGKAKGAQLSECPHCHKTHKLTEGKWRRDLTTFEKTVSLKEIEKTFNTYEQKFNIEAQTIIGAQSENLIAQVDKIIKSGEWGKLRDISAGYSGKYSDKVRDIINELYDFGMKSVAKEIGKKTPTASKYSKTLINTIAETSAKQQGAMLEAKAIRSAMDAYSKGKSPKEILWAVRQDVKEFATRDLTALISSTVGDAINEGRYDTADSLKKDGIINRAQYSAILDDATCDLCEELDGQIIDLDDPEYENMTPPQHYNCRCIWVYIDTDATGAEPDWSGASEKLIDKFSTF